MYFILVHFISCWMCGRHDRTQQNRLSLIAYVFSPHHIAYAARKFLTTVILKYNSCMLHVMVITPRLLRNKRVSMKHVPRAC